MNGMTTKQYNQLIEDARKDRWPLMGGQPDFLLWLHHDKWQYQMAWLSGAWQGKRHNLNFRMFKCP
jgi:hypothetical protein